MRAVKVMAIVLVCVVAVLVAGAAILVSVFDPNDYKDYATSFVEERTGRTLEIAEDLELEFFPWLAIEAGGVTFGNAEGFGDVPFARIDSVAARVKLMPLLGRRLEVGRLVIDGLELNLARDEALRGNWEDLRGRQASAAAPEQAPAGSGAPGGVFGIEGIRIRNGTVNWHENRTDLRFVVSGLALETGAIGATEPVEAEIGFTLLDAASEIRLEAQARAVSALGDDGVQVADFAGDFRVVGPDAVERASGNVALARLHAGAANVEVDGLTARTRVANPERWPDGLALDIAWNELRYDPPAQTLAIDGLVMNAGGVEAAWQIGGESLAEAPRLAGSVRLTADSAESLLAALSAQAPAGIDAGALGPVEAAASFTAEPNALRMSITDVDARLLGMQLTGSAELDANVLSARVAVPRFTPGDPLAALGASVLPEGLDVGALGALALQTSLEADLDSGRTVLRDIRAELLGGTANGEVTLVPAQAGTSVSGTLSASRIAGSALAAVLGERLPQNIGADELGTLAVNARFDYDAPNDRVAVEARALEAFGLAASGNATVAAVSTAPRAAGAIRLQPFAPRALLSRFDQPVPQTSDPTALREAAIDARFDVSGENGRFESITVHLDETVITGSFAVDDFANPSYRFDLSADRVDVDRYLPPPADEVDDGERAAGDIALAPEPLQAFRIAGQARVGDLKLANLRFQDVATRLAIGDGKATIDSAQARLYGGTFDGGFFVDTTGAQPSMTLRGRATQLALTPLIEALVGDANVSGTGSFDIDLTGRGPTVTDNLRSASGSMGFALRDGAIDGFNLGHVLCQAYNVLQRLPAPPEQPKETPYQLIEANATVDDGVATSPELVARAPFMEVTGGGRLVLAEQTLDYDLRARLTDSIAIPRCEPMDRLVGGSIPFTIRGTVTDAEIRPDFSQIIQDRVRDEIQDRLRDRLQDRLRDLL